MKKTTKTSPKKAKQIKVDYASAHKQTMQDLKTATLITSGLANLFILIGWMVVQTTSQFDQEVVSIIFK